MTNHPKTLEEALAMFDDFFEEQAVYPEVSVVSLSKDQIKSVLTTIWHAGKESMIGDIENWKYTYDNYPTMMKSKRSFDKGSMARELAKDLLEFLADK